MFCNNGLLCFWHISVRRQTVRSFSIIRKFQLSVFSDEIGADVWHPPYLFPEWLNLSLVSVKLWLAACCCLSPSNSSNTISLCWCLCVELTLPLKELDNITLYLIGNVFMINKFLRKAFSFIKCQTWEHDIFWVKYEKNNSHRADFTFDELFLVWNEPWTVIQAHIYKYNTTLMINHSV